MSADVEYPVDALSIAVQAVSKNRLVDDWDREVEINWSHHPAYGGGCALLFARTVLTRGSVTVLGRQHQPAPLASWAAL